MCAGRYIGDHESDLLLPLAELINLSLGNRDFDPLECADRFQNFETSEWPPLRRGAEVGDRDFALRWIFAKLIDD